MPRQRLVLCTSVIRARSCALVGFVLHSVAGVSLVACEPSDKPPVAPATKGTVIDVGEGSTSPVTSTPARVGPSSAPKAQCASIPAPDTYHQAVDGAHRTCETSDDCHTVILSCSNLDCSGVHKRFAESYKDDLDCKGYTGMVGNYDCRARFNIEHAVCQQGCCVSERIEPPAN